MSVVYKYFGSYKENGKPDSGSHGLDVLEHFQLKVTPPNQLFNAPFEFSPHSICTEPTRRTKEIWKTKWHVDDAYNALVAAGRNMGSRRDFRRYVKHHRQEIAEEMAQPLADAAAESCRELLNNISKKAGLLCLSKTKTSILMWGHYASTHQGLVIGFDTTKEVLRPPKALSVFGFGAASVTG